MDAPWSVSPTSIAAFILFIGVLIFVHELGHFLAAKYFDIKVVKFSLGFGPSIISFQKGETTYQIAAIPLGGFVKMVGDNPADEVAPEDEARAFTTAPIHQRAIVALAGPLFNLIFPVICFFAYNVVGPKVISPVVGQLEIGKPADLAGLQTGDRIVAVDGSRVWGFRRLRELVEKNSGEPIALTILREDKRFDVKVKPEATPQTDMFGKRETRGRIGVSQARVGTRIGVWSQSKNKGGFLTGDRIISIGGKRVSKSEQLAPEVRKSAGKQVEVWVSRPQPLMAGDLLFANNATPTKLSVPIPEGAKTIEDIGLRPSETFIRGVVPGGAADRAGLRPGDQIIGVAGNKIRLFWSFLTELKGAEDKPLKLEVARDGKVLNLTLQATKVKCMHQVTRMESENFDPGVGVGPFEEGSPCQVLGRRNQYFSHWPSSVAPEVEEAHLTLLEALQTSVRQTVEVIGFVALGLYKLFARQISVNNVGGPLQLFKLAAQAVELGIFQYLQTLALISVNLGLINLLPIPIFDGGHLLFCAIEAVKRRPVSLRTREAASLVGLVLLLALLVLALRNDILSLEIF